MTLTTQDRIDINDLINLHGHLADAGEFAEMAELFTPDVTYDLHGLGMESLHGTAALIDAARAMGAANPVGHHVTNVVITQVDEGSARVQSKGIGIMADGTAGSVVYEDVVTRRPDGWKISYRKVISKRGNPREVLERFRHAVINQSIEDMKRLYAADAVHEFPFTRPGLPSRLTGRDEIMDWVVTAWQAVPLKYERYRTLTIHDTADPETIIVEQEALGAEFTLPNVIVLTVRNGQIVHLRDYVNIPAVEAALGQEI